MQSPISPPMPPAAPNRQQFTQSYAQQFQHSVNSDSSSQSLPSPAFPKSAPVSQFNTQTYQAHTQHQQMNHYASTPPPAGAPGGGQVMNKGTLKPGQKLTVNTTSVVVERYLNEGGFATVYLVNTVPTDSRGGGAQKLVLKRMLVRDPAMLKEVRREVDVMKLLRGHPNIIQLYDADAFKLPDGSTEVFILMEYAAGGGIIDLMNSRLQDRLRESEILQIFVDVCEGVAKMHSLNPPLLHRDLKVENILLSSPTLFKLCDFGSVTTPNLTPPQTVDELKASELDINTHTTMQYRAPEMCDVWLRRPVAEPSDVWALGVLLYKLCFYTTPFEAAGPLAQLNAQYQIPPFPHYSPAMIELISSMLREHAHKRPTVFQLLDQVHRIRGTRSMFHYDPPKKMSYVSPQPTMAAAPPPMQVQQSLPSVAPMRRGRPTPAAKQAQNAVQRALDDAKQAQEAEPTPEPESASVPAPPKLKIPLQLTGEDPEASKPSMADKKKIFESSNSSPPVAQKASFVSSQKSPAPVLSPSAVSPPSSATLDRPPLPEREKSFEERFPDIDSIHTAFPAPHLAKVSSSSSYGSTKLSNTAATDDKQAMSLNVTGGEVKKDWLTGDETPTGSAASTGVGAKSLLQKQGSFGFDSSFAPAPTTSSSGSGFESSFAPLVSPVESNKKASLNGFESDFDSSFKPTSPSPPVSGGPTKDFLTGDDAFGVSGITPSMDLKTLSPSIAPTSAPSVYSNSFSSSSGGFDYSSKPPTSSYKSNGFGGMPKTTYEPSASKPTNGSSSSPAPNTSSSPSRPRAMSNLSASDYNSQRSKTYPPAPASSTPTAQAPSSTSRPEGAPSGPRPPPISTKPILTSKPSSGSTSILNDNWSPLESARARFTQISINSPMPSSADKALPSSKTANDRDDNENDNDEGPEDPVRAQPPANNFSPPAAATDLPKIRPQSVYSSTPASYTFKQPELPVKKDYNTIVYGSSSTSNASKRSSQSMAQMHQDPSKPKSSDLTTATTTPSVRSKASPMIIQPKPMGYKPPSSSTSHLRQLSNEGTSGASVKPEPFSYTSRPQVSKTYTSQPTASVTSASQSSATAADPPKEGLDEDNLPSVGSLISKWNSIAAPEKEYSMAGGAGLGRSKTTTVSKARGSRGGYI